MKVRGFRVELGEIEVTLGQHPQVREAVVFTRDDTEDTQLIAYVVPHDGIFDKNKDEFRSEQVAHWEQIWDTTYSNSSSANSLPPALYGLNLHGWRDSYSGQPIPKPQMREWADSTVARIRAWQPKRVLELGCGTGMLLLRIAPHCLSYVGTDLSQPALQLVKQQLQAAPAEILADVRLYHQAADNFDRLTDETFDTVIINSVVELFPSMEYLVEVLEKAVHQVTPAVLFSWAMYVVTRY